MSLSFLSKSPTCLSFLIALFASCPQKLRLPRSGRFNHHQKSQRNASSRRKGCLYLPRKTRSRPQKMCPQTCPTLQNAPGQTQSQYDLPLPPPSSSLIIPLLQKHPPPIVDAHARIPQAQTDTTTTMWEVVFGLDCTHNLLGLLV